MENGIIIATFVLMFFVFLYFWKLQKHTELIASIVTVIGVLGTFVGIAYGLYMFDVQNIESSIPNLLGGLKIAFITSIGGITLSIVLKSRAAMQHRKCENSESGPAVGATIDPPSTFIQ